MNINEMYRDLTAIAGKNYVFQNEPMAGHTLTKMGGKADILVQPASYQAAADIIKYTVQHQIPFMLLGNGSNMIVRDGGIRGIVMHLTHLSEIEVQGTSVVAQGGANIIDASITAMDHCLTGFEFACGIPGSVGGAMVMNAGAYGGEIKDIIDYVRAIDANGEIVTLTKDELELSYRSSIILKKGYIVLEAVFQLEKGDAETIRARVDDLTHQRETKQPLEYPSVGSVFKRPPGYFAGKLIQDSELQGQGVGGAEVSTKHAGFIVNKEDATATDYIETIELVRRTVKEKFGVELELEAKIVGEEPKERK
ncbi:UDP-N-acetylmuramate dehydrogenase [Salisediminibacterium halotolerans]|uniref:UDP-N-acetylmuramate dehydrogenase n=1 Tax=Salisediminibacterium halotolerans TaxID=517425 RepID=UPI000EAEB9EA|nr:UDP-N-acetylmuramate dehydrogenase [Salisediminibacterium halotolerans]RLJ73253.1 UDP-N-acetylmuramate dehydrogenase [Actinophytocola xinjiangensis]RPE86675.1 UDP-N-acetylmuramate dehydrogenase [Salisediminibacterium halotolerans]TWG34050.1 UDP-N-acetylmuramate dehydrogenase [Salisediminibacterium halotolerans]GEL09177.1 UDP-N-acetylenolpyruvoylglucosamine reductase 2 [Salisediminibacterium halotolerans]